MDEKNHDSYNTTPSRTYVSLPEQSLTRLVWRSWEKKKRRGRERKFVQSGLQILTQGNLRLRIQSQLQQVACAHLQEVEVEIRHWARGEASYRIASESVRLHVGSVTGFSLLHHYVQR